MPKYKDIDNDSSVTAYKLKGRGIVVEFDGEKRFYYSERKHVRKMKKLAKAGDGLNAYVNINKPEYKRVRRK